MKVFGIDPGSDRTGYGCVETDGSRHRLVTCGATSGFAGNLDIRYLFSRQISLLGAYMGAKAELIEAMKFFAAGRLIPVVDRVLPLEQAADAHRILEDRAQFGKVVLEP